MCCQEGNHFATGIWYLTVVDGKIADVESTFDTLNLVKQIGGKVIAPQS
jgi:hypothetical protein